MHARYYVISFIVPYCYKENVKRSTCITHDTQVWRAKEIARFRTHLREYRLGGRAWRISSRPCPRTGATREVASRGAWRRIQAVVSRPQLCSRPACRPGRSRESRASERNRARGRRVLERRALTRRALTRRALAHRSLGQARDRLNLGFRG
jgi:hypothetical protein